MWPFIPARGYTGPPAEVTVVADSTAHVKGAWTEASSSIPAGVTGLSIGFVDGSGSSSSGGDGRALLDVGVGGAGSEVVVVPNLGIGTVGANMSAPQRIPISLPEGARLALRAQSAVVSRSLLLQADWIIDGLAFTPAATGGCVALGANTSTSGGVGVTASAGWVEVVASTPDRLVGLLPQIQTSSASGATGSVVQVGVGAAGVEQILGAWRIYTSTSEQVFLRDQTPAWVQVPAGSRLSVRVLSSSGQTLYIHLLGLT